VIQPIQTNLKTDYFGAFYPICSLKAQSLTSPKLNKNLPKSSRFEISMAWWYHPEYRPSKGANIVV